MLTEDVRPSSIEGIKRLANQIKKARGIPHSESLKVAAKAASFENFAHAQRILTERPASGGHRYQLFLTIYWSARKPYRAGRETLEIWLTRPLLDVCSKGEMKRVTGLADMRLVAPDHLVSDGMAQSQDYARRQLLKSLRALRFMEATGLKPCTYELRHRATRGLDDRLPQTDHSTGWIDPASGQYVMVDEPYLDPVVKGERADWASRNGWHLDVAKWPGIYMPGSCSFFVATNAANAYDFQSLMGKINALPAITDEWTGISVDGHETFISPCAVTPQDRRRARSKGTILPLSSRHTLPYSGIWGDRRRRPNGAMPVAGHQQAGRMIKAVLGSDQKPWAVNTRMNSVRSTLEDWLSLEIGQSQLQGPEFFDVYYHDIDEDDPFAVTCLSAEGVIQTLCALKGKLEQAYSDCAPLRKLMRKIGTSLKLIERQMSGAGTG